MLNVHVSTLVFGGGETESPLPDVKLQLVSQRVSVQTIISQAVEEQINLLLKKHHEDTEYILAQLDKQYLEQTDVDRQTQHGKVAFKRRAASDLTMKFDIESEIQRAFKAFSDSRFKMFVDSEEVIGLDHTCTIMDGTSIKFIRLIPLQGG